MIEHSNSIPSGMYRLVKRSNAMQKRHPVRDASLTGCMGRYICLFSTERLIPNGSALVHYEDATSGVGTMYTTGILNFGVNQQI